MTAQQGPGLFVTFEGPEGAGKTTQTALLRAALEADGVRVVGVREPGGTVLGGALRELLLRPDAPPDPRAEALLYCAARRQLVAEVIRPALAEGAVVVADRYADSTLAYQGAGRGLPLNELRAVIGFATEDCLPDLTFLLDLPVDEGLGRKRRQSVGAAEWTRFEAEAAAFHERVRRAFLDLAAAEPGRWQVLDARTAPEKLHQTILETVLSRLSRR